MEKLFKYLPGFVWVKYKYVPHGFVTIRKKYVVPAEEMEWWESVGFYV